RDADRGQRGAHREPRARHDAQAVTVWVEVHLLVGQQMRVRGCDGTVARVVYPRFFPDRTKSQTERLNKSPHTVHAFAKHHKNGAASLCAYCIVTYSVVTQT